MSKSHVISPLDGWGGSIVAALHETQAEDVITLQPGQYQGNETLLINRPLTLQGSEGVELVYTGKESAIQIEKTDNVSIIDIDVRFLGQFAHEPDTAKRSNCIKSVCSQQITIQGCRCQGNGNADYGIYLLSSTGRIENNECTDNKRSGIALALDPETPDHLSEAQLTNNRCHNNECDGISFVSSYGQTENNVCWGNKGCGIALVRGSNTPDYPSEAILTGNRCHNNEVGIGFLSSNGQAINNDCYRNKNGGIVLHRESDTPNHPSVSTLTGNRCYENGQAGILFHSSNGQVEGNERYRNKMHGISLQSTLHTLCYPSFATLIDNYCHDNERKGIAFFSSKGQATDNDCSRNKSSGIALQRNPDTLDHPSEAMLTGNRCHDNDGPGIFFSSSNGQAANNACWGNKYNSIVEEQYFSNGFIGPQCSVEKLHNVTEPTITVE